MLSNTDTNGSTVQIESCWSGNEKGFEISTQTQSLAFADSDTQTVTVQEMETQTAEIDTAEEQTQKFPSEEGNWPATDNLASFLRSVEHDIITQLEQNLESHAFDDYEAETENDEESATLLHTLSYDITANNISENSESTPVDLQVTGLSWNSTGSVIAVTYGRHDLSGWCDLPGALCCWNLFHKDFSPQKPNIVIDTQSCLMCVACHPEKPAVVAAGSFNGEVYVWNTSSEEQLVACTKIDDYFHREPIAKVAWVYNMRSHRYEVVSISGDGNVLFWSLETKLAYPQQGFRLSRSPGEGVRSAYGQGKGQVFGGTAMAFGAGRVSSSFVVGTEGGSIYRSSLNRFVTSANHLSQQPADAVIKWNDQASVAIQNVPSREKPRVVKQVEEWYRKESEGYRKKGVREITTQVVYDAKPDPSALFPRPMDFKFDPHAGPVHALDCSPFHRNLFLSAGADGELKLFSMLQDKALMSLQPSPTYLYCAVWSRTRPLVLAAGAEDGKAYIYDLGQSLTNPVATIDCCEGIGNKTAPVYAMVFNPKQRDFVATGNGNGHVHIWKLSWLLSNLQAAEHTDLDSIIKSSMQDDEAE